MNANVTASYPTIHNVENRYVHGLDRQYVFHSWAQQGSLDPMVIAGAEGCRVWDYTGQSYLDFSSQLVNTNIDHQHPKMVSAIQAQTANLCTIAPAHANLARGEAAKRIIAKAPAGFSKVFFTKPQPEKAAWLGGIGHHIAHTQPW